MQNNSLSKKSALGQAFSHSHGKIGQGGKCWNAETWSGAELAGTGDWRLDIALTCKSSSYDLSRGNWVCYDRTRTKFCFEGGERHGGPDLSGRGSEKLLRIRRVRGAGSGPPDHKPSGGGPEPDGENHLPGRDAVPESLGHLRPGAAVRGGPAGQGGQR